MKNGMKVTKDGLKNGSPSGQIKTMRSGRKDDVNKNRNHLLNKKKRPRRRSQAQNLRERLRRKRRRKRKERKKRKAYKTYQSHQQKFLFPLFRLLGFQFHLMMRNPRKSHVDLRPVSRQNEDVPGGDAARSAVAHGK